MEWYVTVGVVASVITIGLFVTGAWVKLRNVARAVFGRARPYPSPAMTIVPRPNSMWWHMGSMNNADAMQIVARWTVTGVGAQPVHVARAYIRHGRQVFDASCSFIADGVARDPSNWPIGGTSVWQHALLDTHFFVQPPFASENEPCEATIVIVDNFGNEYPQKRTLFPYR